MSQAIHRFFDERDFNYVHTPIITDSDCEGAGEMFRVTTLEPTSTEKQSFDNDFFEKPTFLTVRGRGLCHRPFQHLHLWPHLPR